MLTETTVLNVIKTIFDSIYSININRGSIISSNSSKKMLLLKGYTNYYLFILLDINECDEDSDGCAHQCTNTISSYYCSCNTGYSLDTDGYGCTSEFISI